ncbi:hypothetical protein NE237_022782 [Protea cynaroides]|uniref:Uncharacterized protein n=1 Tax=Protea cynaroides TaxID=273540 RepID=A0A9Q0HDQ0_9MAGN|nr:hypothetical protein NE237_022782 [Protea cynaroides]
MFRIHEKRIENVDKPIDMLVHEVKVTIPNSTLYYINGYPSAVIGRDESEGKEVDIFGNVEDVVLQGLSDAISENFLVHSMEIALAIYTIISNISFQGCS